MCYIGCCVEATTRSWKCNTNHEYERIRRRVDFSQEEFLIKVQFQKVSKQDIVLGLLDLSRKISLGDCLSDYSVAETQS